MRNVLPHYKSQIFDNVQRSMKHLFLQTFGNCCCPEQCFMLSLSLFEMYLYHVDLFLKLKWRG